jgi:hypothetical protein
VLSIFTTTIDRVMLNCDDLVKVVEGNRAALAWLSPQVGVTCNVVSHGQLYLQEAFFTLVVMLQLFGAVRKGRVETYSTLVW